MQPTALLLAALAIVVAFACIAFGTIELCNEVLPFDWTAATSGVAPARDVVVVLP